jgi:hypothetical protein
VDGCEEHEEEAGREEEVDADRQSPAECLQRMPRIQ